MHKNLVNAFLMTVISTALLFSMAGAFLIVTPLGGKLLVRYFKQRFAAVGLMHVGHFEGSLHQGFSLKNITIKGLTYMPDAVMMIQEIDVRLPLWDWPHAYFSIFNARLKIPDSDPVVFTGTISGGMVKGNLYAKSVDLHAASRFWGDAMIKDMRGFISDLDLEITGPARMPHIEGNFTADTVRYKSVLLTDGLASVNLYLLPGEGQLKGEVSFHSGLVNVRNTNLELAPSRFIFRGDVDVQNPVLDIHLVSKVEDMQFHLAIIGTAGNPQLLVSSDPPMPPDEALQVIFTGNAWATSTSPIRGVSSSQLAENFLNYSFQDATTDQQLGLKRKLTDNLKLGVEMDQVPAPPGVTNTFYSRKINGELDMNDHVSLNVSQEVMPQQRDAAASGQENQAEGPETQIYMQYKKRF